MPVEAIFGLIQEKLSTAQWPNIEFDEEQQRIKCPLGDILCVNNSEICLKFFHYNSKTSEYTERNISVMFSNEFDISKYLYFRLNGKYSISNENEFRKIINPSSKPLKKIRIISGTQVRRFNKTTLTLSPDFFTQAVIDGNKIYKKCKSYALSVQNYLTRLESSKYSNDAKKKTTYIEKGELAFCVDRLNLSTKKNKNDFDRFIDRYDVDAIEALTDRLIRFSIISPEFLRRLQDYFIREKLKDIIDLGKQILRLKKNQFNGTEIREILEKLELKEVGQLETLWQRYFEKYLLYLIFAYKKIFPKVELQDIDGNKKFPDFIGVNHYNGLDIIEIKTHLAKILMWDNSHKNFYFSSEVSKAIVQTTNYMDSIIRARFKNHHDKTKITKYTEKENLYHPRSIIVISSKNNLTTKKGENDKLQRDFTKLRNSLHNIEILTFDEIIGIADEYLNNILDTNPDSEEAL